MAMIRVTASELKTRAEELSGMNADLKNAIAEYQNDVQILHGNWEGDASDAFYAFSQQDVDKMEQFYALIQQYIETLNSMAQNYEITESKNVNIATKRSYS